MAARFRMPGFKGSMAALMLVGAVGVALALWEPGQRRPVLRPGDLPAPVPPASAPAVAAPAPMVPRAAGVVPSFDVVRVSPQGDAVIAGRAAAGSEVVVFDGDRAVARATADLHGEFVVVPAEPLPAGGRELTLAARPAGGGAEVRGEQSVVLVVPEARRGGAEAPPVVALLDANGGARVLQDGGKRGQALSLDAVNYNEKGGVRFSGRAAAGAAVRVYVDNGAVGDVRADGAGRWELAPAGEIAAGMHKLRADAVDGGGRVVSRVELPFQRASGASMAGGRVVVQPGETLWRLARTAYGNGGRYTVIFQANQGQIRDPGLIYPGQAFAVPAAP